MNLPFTTSCTNASDCPRKFDAKHLYFPEVLPVTLYKINSPPESADCFRSDLLHTTVGSGLPVTEH